MIATFDCIALPHSKPTEEHASTALSRRGISFAKSISAVNVMLLSQPGGNRSSLPLGTFSFHDCDMQELEPGIYSLELAGGGVQLPIAGWPEVQSHPWQPSWYQAAVSLYTRPSQLMELSELDNVLPATTAAQQA